MPKTTHETKTGVKLGNGMKCTDTPTPGLLLERVTLGRGSATNYEGSNKQFTINVKNMSPNYPEDDTLA